LEYTKEERVRHRMRRDYEIMRDMILDDEMTDEMNELWDIIYWYIKYKYTIFLEFR